MRFNAGDRVIVKMGLEGGKSYGDVYLNAEMKHLAGKILTIKSTTHYCVPHYKVEENNWTWSDEMLEGVAKIEAGDKVAIRKDCTIAELSTNSWNKAFKDTLSFLAEYGKDVQKVFTVKSVSDRGNIVIEDDFNENLYVNYNLLELVEKKVVKEMTVEEVCKELGYEVKIKRG